MAGEDWIDNYAVACLEITHICADFYDHAAEFVPQGSWVLDPGCELTPVDVEVSAADPGGQGIL
jgi:hypothetical protein